MVPTQMVSPGPQIKSARVLMVGAGGIGCELLKTLVLTGFENNTLVRPVAEVLCCPVVHVGVSRRTSAAAEHCTVSEWAS